MIEKTYLRIRQLRCTPGGNSSDRLFTIPDVVTPVVTDQKVKSVLRGSKGSSTGLPKNHYFAALLLRNEINGCVAGAQDREALRRTIRKEFKDWRPATLRNFISRFSEHRDKYNSGRLYKNQPMPPLWCWYWNADGYIQHPKHKRQFLGFEYCKRILKSNKFADPRFFDSDELSVITNNWDVWHVPSNIEIQQIEAQIEKPVYNSIEWPEGYEKGRHPI